MTAGQLSEAPPAPGSMSIAAVEELGSADEILELKRESDKKEFVKA